MNVHLSTNGGQDWVLIDSNRSGTVSRYKVPLTQTPSNFCLVRVMSTANGQFYGDSKTFAIVSGSLALIVPVSAVVTFPAEPTISTYYRLVSHPGVVDTLVRLNVYIPGSNPQDWRLFADNGLPENYLVEMGPSSAFETGRGYWLLKRNDLTISANMVMPPLDTVNAVFRIRLRSGWNIVANPFDKNVSWGSILALNGLPSSTPLYGYEGSYQGATVLAPFRGYYYFNTNNLTELKIAYPFGTTLPSVAARDVEWELRLEYSSEINDDPANFIGVASSAREGLDDLDNHKPPIFLDQGFLYFRRPEWDSRYDLFSTDYRPSVGEGQTWKFEVSREYGTTGTLRFDGLDGIPPEYEVYLVNGFNNTPVNLRERPEYSFTSVSTKMPFRILVGPKGYVERAGRGGHPEGVRALAELPESLQLDDVDQRGVAPRLEDPPRRLLGARPEGRNDRRRRLLRRRPYLPLGGDGRPRAAGVERRLSLQAHQRRHDGAGQKNDHREIGEL